MDERTDLRDTFELAAAHYHEARPRYPAALFDALAQLAGLEAQAEILEVGPATGVATEQLARMGHRLTCIELGADLAHAACRNLAGFPAVSVINDSFDTWDPPSWGSFDLVFAATSWHWLDPHTKYERAHRHLRPKGTLAFALAFI